MPRRAILNTVVLTVVCLLAHGAGLFAQEPPAVKPQDLVGHWEGAAQTPNGEVTLKVDFALKDDKLVSTIDSSMGSLPVTSTTLTGDRLQMEIEVAGGVAALVAKVQPTKIEGTWTLGADSGPFSLTKSPGTGAAGSR